MLRRSLLTALLLAAALPGATAHALCCRADAAAEVRGGWFAKAPKAGFKTALGSDTRPLKDAALLEMGLWARDGATPRQTLGRAGA